MHLQDVHCGLHAQYVANRATTTSTSSSKRTVEEDTLAEQPASKKAGIQKTIQDQLKPTTPRNKPASQSEFKQELINMIVEDMQPIALVERSGFQNFCHTLLPHIQMPSRRTVSREINTLYDEKKHALIMELEKVKYVSVTADLWSSHKRGFLGVTIHYVDEITVQRKSNVLACRRFKHSHTGEQIAKMMSEIFEEFQVATKITCCVTDNAANIVKAIRLLPKPLTLPMDTPDTADSITQAESNNEVEVENDQDDDSVEVLDIQELIHGAGEVVDPELVAMLNKQIRCANHSLNLIAAVDSKSARSADNYKRSYDRAMSKVQALSNAVNTSTKSADIVEDTIGVTFLNPTCTRWSSDFTAVSRVVEVGLAKVRECQTKIGVAWMTEADMLFLKQYIQVMKPIAAAMVNFQAEDDCFIGHVIPTVLGIKTKLESMMMRVEDSIKPLVKALLDGINLRFQTVLSDDQYHIATMLIPRFRLNYLPPNARLVKKHVLLQAVTSMNSNKEPNSSSSMLQTAMTSTIREQQYPYTYSYYIALNSLI